MFPKFGYLNSADHGVNDRSGMPFYAPGAENSGVNSSIPFNCNSELRFTISYHPSRLCTKSVGAAAVADGDRKSDAAE